MAGKWWIRNSQNSDWQNTCLTLQSNAFSAWFTSVLRSITTLCGSGWWRNHLHSSLNVRASIWGSSCKNIQCLHGPLGKKVCTCTYEVTFVTIRGVWISLTVCIRNISRYTLFPHFASRRSFRSSNFNRCCKSVGNGNHLLHETDGPQTDIGPSTGDHQIFVVSTSIALSQVEYILATAFSKRHRSSNWLASTRGC